MAELVSGSTAISTCVKLSKVGANIAVNFGCLKLNLVIPKLSKKLSTSLLWIYPKQEKGVKSCILPTACAVCQQFLRLYKCFVALTVYNTCTFQSGTVVLLLEYKK